MYCFKKFEIQSSKQTEIVLCVCCILLSLVNWIVERLGKGKAHWRADRHWSCVHPVTRDPSGSLFGLQMDGHVQLCVFWCGFA